MFGYQEMSGYQGLPPISLAGVPDATQRIPLGTIVSATDFYWGGGEFIYLQMPLSQAVKVGGVLSYDVATAFLAALMANTAILGKSAAICMNVVASSASAQYAWCGISGQLPVWSNASVAANVAIGTVAAGQGGALAAGKQLNNARVTLPATTTVAKTATTVNGSPILTIISGDAAGWFPGVAVTGTGIPASTTITGISPSGKSITMSANATADGAVTVTGTYNDATNFYNIVTCDRLGMQGPIT